MFQFWFHTAFVKHDILVVTKQELDDFINDTDNVSPILPTNFKLELYFQSSEKWRKPQKISLEPTPGRDTLTVEDLATPQHQQSQQQKQVQPPQEEQHPLPTSIPVQTTLLKSEAYLRKWKGTEPLKTPKGQKESELEQRIHKIIVENQARLSSRLFSANTMPTAPAEQTVFIALTVTLP